MQLVNTWLINLLSMRNFLPEMLEVTVLWIISNSEFADHAPRSNVDVSWYHFSLFHIASRPVTKFALHTSAAHARGQLQQVYVRITCDNSSVVNLANVILRQVSENIWKLYGSCKLFHESGNRVFKYAKCRYTKGVTCVRILQWTSALTVLSWIILSYKTLLDSLGVQIR